MSGFWNWWIAGLTTANVAFALWLFFSTSHRKSGDQQAGPETTGHTWDGDLAEYNNPLPRWWLWGFYISVTFAVAYLVIYPGFGSFTGTAGWTQTKAWESETREANALYAREFARFDTMTVADLTKDPGALRVAKNLFAANCAMCHGTDARGAKGFPNLTSPNLSWGGDADSVLATISNGRQGVMPAWKDTIGADAVNAVANYVYTLSGHSAPAELAAAGKTTFETMCTACHGADGRGNPLLGAPNLTDKVWIYGGSLDTIKETVANGRSNRMPAHLELLGAQKVKLLAAYVLSLSSAQAAATGSSAPGG